jgi:hypothetical protein
MRVYLTTRELATMLAFIDANYGGIVSSKSLIAANTACQPEDRQLVAESFYKIWKKPGFQARLAKARDYLQTTRVHAPPPAPAPEPEPASFADLVQPADAPEPATLAEQIAAILLPSLRQMVQDELAAFAAAVGSQMSPSATVAVPMQGNEMLMQYARRRRRVDVVGLLPSQVNIVRGLLSDTPLNIRYIASEHANRVDKYAPDVVLVSGFVSHSHQSKAKHDGATIHYANGAAHSVVDTINKISG